MGRGGAKGGAPGRRLPSRACAPRGAGLGDDPPPGGAGEGEPHGLAPSRRPGRALGSPRGRRGGLPRPGGRGKASGGRRRRGGGDDGGVILGCRGRLPAPGTARRARSAAPRAASLDAGPEGCASCSLLRGGGARGALPWGGAPGPARFRGPCPAARPASGPRAFGRLPAGAAFPPRAVVWRSGAGSEFPRQRRGAGPWGGRVGGHPRRPPLQPVWRLARPRRSSSRWPGTPVASGGGGACPSRASAPP